ncbi:hypothetical protein [Rhodovulum sp.]|nr:hypothetical protein [Rhodovulum sp.]
MRLTTEAAGREGLVCSAFETLIARPDGEREVSNPPDGVAGSADSTGHQG